MSVLFLVIPIALLASAAAAWAFAWAIRRGEFDDLTTPAYRMLEDDDGRVLTGPIAPKALLASAAPVTGRGADDQERSDHEQAM